MDAARGYFNGSGTAQEASESRLCAPEPPAQERPETTFDYGVEGSGLGCAPSPIPCRCWTVLRRTRWGRCRMRPCTLRTHRYSSPFPRAVEQGGEAGSVEGPPVSTGGRLDATESAHLVGAAGFRQAGLDGGGVDALIGSLVDDLFSPPAQMSDDPHGSEANAPKVADPPEEMVTPERSAFAALNRALMSPTMTHPARQCRTMRCPGDSPSNTPILRLSRISSTTCSSAGPAAWGGPVAKSSPCSETGRSHGSLPYGRSSAAFAEFEVPGRAGSLFQDLDAAPARVAISGSLYGDEDRDDFVEELRGKFRAGEPVTFVADILTATEVRYVIIEAMRLQESGVRPDQTDYLFVLRESPPPPPPPDPLGIDLDSWIRRTASSTR